MIALLYKNPEKYGIDKNQIGVYGVSGGGYELSGAGMILAQKNHSYMAKSFYMITPMLDDTTWTMPTEKLNAQELFKRPISKSTMAIHAEGFKDKVNDPNLYPSKMSDALLKKFPRTIVASVEFDTFKHETDKFVDRLKKAGTLDEYVVYPGSVHSFIGIDHNTHYVWLDLEKNFKKWVDCYLRK